MKALLDFIPILAFFITYIFFGQDLYLAVKVIMVATAVQLAVLWIKDRKISRMHMISGALLLGLGGLTLALNNDLFIKWKPTVVNWLFAAVFAGSLWIGEKPMMQRVAEESMPLDAKSWRQLTSAYAWFFGFLGVLNLIVVYNVSEATWVKFKLFGLMGLTVLFMLAQGVWIMKKLPAEQEESQ